MICTTLYQCEKCMTIYSSAELAQACEAQTIEPIAQPGEIVLAKGSFGWFDGDKSWISNPDVKLKINGYKCPNGDDNCFGSCCNYAFYYVVGAVTLDQPDNVYVRGRVRDELREHRWKYHLFTRAMSSIDGYGSGYTYDHGHYTPRRVEPQPKLDGAEAFIGQRSKHLL